MTYINLVATAAASAQILAEDFQGHPLNEQWADGGTYDQWFDRFNGFGTQTIVMDTFRVLQQTPKKTTRKDETHACLSTSLLKFNDFSVVAKARTVQQLRKRPNSWERDWLLWQYTDNSHFYYVVCKSTGWEVGKADPAYAGSQRFLGSGSNFICPVGTWHTYQVTQTGETLSVSIDGKQLFQFTDTERPYLSGHLGLYTEDAQVSWSNITVSERSSPFVLGFLDFLKSLDWVESIETLYESLKGKASYSFIDQLSRAVLAIPLNIVEDLKRDLG